METVTVTLVDEVPAVEVRQNCIRITIADEAPTNPEYGDLWVDTSGT